MQKVSDMEEGDTNNKDNSIPAANADDMIKLQEKTVALEKKLMKYIAHSASLTKEKESMKEMIRETISELDCNNSGDNDLGSSVVSICERLHTLEEECDSLNEAKHSLQRSIAETENVLNETAKSKVEIEDKLEISKQEVKALSKIKKQLEHITENLKGSSKDVEDEKNRQVAYLEKENLSIIEENKKLKNEVRTMRAKNKAVSLGLKESERTEELGSILSMTSNNSHYDKENAVNGLIKSSRKSLAKAEPNKPAGLGSGEGETHDDNTQECQQS